MSYVPPTFQTQRGNQSKGLAMGAQEEELSTVTVGEAMEALENAGYDPYETLVGVIARRPDALDLLHRILGIHTEGGDDRLEVA